MRKSRIKNIIIHTVDDTGSCSLSEKINKFHVDVIEHRLKQLNLPAEKKNVIIDKIIENLKLREIDGIIK